ncbi:WD repeat-containing protein 53 [Entomophthora muscae]|uniref:WD repeat-containing protein 53 n=1 Tax=Entomophthora muscae TaxID=34485 RepID=A0ACC2SN54_9FUNG|nr:WD repeat-containing protein 53 [Entomophthora muscae]
MGATTEIQPLIRFHGHKDQVTCLDKSSNKPLSSVAGHDLLLSGADDCTVRLWDARGGKVSQAIKGFRDTISSVVIPEVHHCSFSFYVASGNEIREFDIRNSSSIIDAQRDVLSCLSVGEEDINQFKFRLQGNALLSTNDDGNLYVSHVSGQAKGSRVIGKHSNISLAIAINPVNQEVSSGGMDHHIKIWDAETSELIKDFDMNHPDFLSDSATTSGVNPRFVCSLDFNATGTILTAGLGDGSIKLFNFAATRPPKNKHHRPWKSMDLPEPHRHSHLQSVTIPLANWLIF